MIRFIIGAAASVILSEYTKKSSQSKMAHGGSVIDYNKFIRAKTDEYRKEGYDLIDAIDTAFRDLGLETNGKFEKKEFDKLVNSNANVKKAWKDYKKNSEIYVENGYYVNPYQYEMMASGGGVSEPNIPLTQRSKKSKVEKFFSLLFESRDVAHKEHLKTESYATHVALNEYYDGVLPLIDGMVESYQGMYGIVNIPEWTPKYENPIKYLKDLLKTIDRDKDKLFTDSSLLNQVDEVKALVQSTLYKLENLK